VRIVQELGDGGKGGINVRSEEARNGDGWMDMQGWSMGETDSGLSGMCFIISSYLLLS